MTKTLTLIATLLAIVSLILGTMALADGYLYEISITHASILGVEFKVWMISTFTFLVLAALFYLAEPFDL